MAFQNSFAAVAAGPSAACTRRQGLDRLAETDGGVDGAGVVVERAALPVPADLPGEQHGEVVERVERGDHLGGEGVEVGVARGCGLLVSDSLGPGRGGSVGAAHRGRAFVVWWSLEWVSFLRSSPWLGVVRVGDQEGSPVAAVALLRPRRVSGRGSVVGAEAPHPVRDGPFGHSAAGRHLEPGSAREQQHPSGGFDLAPSSVGP